MSDNSPIGLPTPLTFDNVSLAVDGKHLLRSIQCTIQPHGKTVLLGANGAGKSLFLRLASRLITPTSGRITPMKSSHTDGSQPRQSIVFQKPVLLRRSTIANIEFVLKSDNIKSGDTEQLVNQALIFARLEDKQKTPARKLSGGEQQRLALARAMVIEPAVLFLDEPTASLDPASTKIVEEMIEDADRNGTKIIHVTHDIKQAKRLADDILFMHQGQLVLHQSADEFFAAPACDEAQAYLDGRLT